MTASFLSICALDRCYALFDEYRHLNRGQLLITLAPRVAAAGTSVRRRRQQQQHCRTPSATFSTKRRRQHHQHRGTRHSLSKIAKRSLAMASYQEIRRRSSAADRTPVESSVIASATTSTSTFVPPEKSPLIAAHESTNKIIRNRQQLSGSDAIIMPPPPLPAENTASSSSSSSSSLARQSRSDSSARIPNRLSLTLPIALPTSDPSRPPPTASTSTSSSMPPTPQDRSETPSLSNVNEFITAIAAKERKVLELKEELAHEEAQLAALKKQFSCTDTIHKRGATHQIGFESRASTPTADGDGLSPRRSVDVDRRTQFLQNQSTPTQNRRRVLRGGHTRTLSLLSPARTNSEFSVMNEQTPEDSRFPSIDRGASSGGNPALPKRASWQPRSQQNSPVVPRMVEDFKLGFRSFVEDIRQITIGDEPVNGQTQQRSPHAGHYRTGSLSQGVYTDLGRSRTLQQKKNNNSDIASITAPPTPISKRKDASLENPKPAKSKHFSWTPLGFDSMDDTDWANWESPVQGKSTRWSGSTMNSGIMDDIQSIPENAEESATPIKTKSTVQTPILSPHKLEELLPNVVNRLSPSNIKRTANNLLDEWEKSLVAPSELGVADKENTAT
ncbi:hypothetical protein QQS21_004353 [Conoideocrella luteorostrata]|uniref:DUF4048 domain-containing protein n=1 Tax=Conoideocrella luteorostrata TaxID=1105319 RepID=A0AAJ0G1N6_9HYPO|nr:hypothetical protein QQS21_004353 [Conoideocrella luteorostrata]